MILLAAAAGEARRRAPDQCPDFNPTMSGGGDLVVFAPVLDYTVATFDPSWFATDNPESSPVLFTLQIADRHDSLAGRLRLRVLATADTTLGRNPSAPPVVAFDRVTLPLDAMQIGAFMTSGQVFNLDYEPGGVPFDESDLFDLVVVRRQTPEMNLRFTFQLTCEDNVSLALQNVNIKVSELSPLGGPGKLRFMRTLQALSPGSDVSNVKPASIYTLTPVFQIASELFNSLEFVYPEGEPKMEIFLYRVESGRSPRDALEGMEFARFPVGNQHPAPYPPHLPRLEPGATYAWRARALLRGPDREYRFSNALYFHVDPRLGGGTSMPDPGILSDLRTFEQQVKYGDDYVKRVMAALKIILGENFDVFDLSRADKIPAKGQIRLNGRPYSLEELERLAREIHQSRHSVTRLRFQ